MLDLIPVFAAIALSICALIYAYNVEKHLSRDIQAFDNLADVVVAQDEEIVSILTALEMLTRDVDILFSEGQTKVIPVNTKSQSTAHHVIIENLEEVDDGLPLAGHGLIVGKSGSGKTMVLMSQIIRRVNAGQEVHCIDTKDEVEPIFGQYVTCVGTNAAETKIKEMLSIAKERRQLFKQTTQKTGRPCRDYKEYQKITGQELPIVCLLVEELIVLMGIIDEDPLIEMLVVCRSAGVFVVALAQVIKADILSRKGTLNFNWACWLGPYDRIACGLVFGNLDKVEQKTISDHVGEPGKAVIQVNGELTPVMMPEILEEHLLPYIAGTV